MDKRNICLPCWNEEEEERKTNLENRRMLLAAYQQQIEPRLRTLRKAEAKTSALQARGVDGSSTVQLPSQPISLVYPSRLQTSSSVREEGQSSKCQSSQRQLGMHQHANQNDSEVLNSASPGIQRMPWEVAHQPKVSALWPTVTPSSKKSTDQLTLPMQPEPSERKFSLPLMPSPAVVSERNSQNCQNHRISRPPGFPLPQPRMTAERKANARISTAPIWGDHVRQQPVTLAMVENESPAPCNTWVDALLSQPPPKIEMQPIMTEEQKANASNGPAQVSDVNVQKRLVTDASVQFPPTSETEQLIGNAKSPILPPVSWDPKQKMENGSTAEPISKGVNGEKVIQTLQGQLELIEQQLDALQAFERLKRTIGTLPPESARGARVSILEMEKRLMRLIQTASPDGKVSNNNVKRHDRNIDLGEKVTPPIITGIEEEMLKKEEVDDELSKAEAMKEEEQTLKKEKVSGESAATTVVDVQCEAEAMEEKEETSKKEEVGCKSVATSVVDVQTEPEAIPAVISIHQEKQLQTIEESFDKCNPEAGSVPEEVSSLDGDDENHEMQEWVLVSL